MGLTVDEILHALGPIIEAVKKRPTERHGRGAQTDGFQDIGAATDAAVDVDFEGVEDVRRVAVQVEEDQDGGRGGVEVAPAVIADWQDRVSMESSVKQTQKRQGEGKGRGRRTSARAGWGKKHVGRKTSDIPHNNAIQTLLGRSARIRSTHDALEHNLPFPMPSQPR